MAVVELMHKHRIVLSSYPTEYEKSLSWWASRCAYTQTVVSKVIATKITLSAIYFQAPSGKEQGRKYADNRECASHVVLLHKFALQRNDALSAHLNTSEDRGKKKGTEGKDD